MRISHFLNSTHTHARLHYAAIISVKQKKKKTREFDNKQSSSSSKNVIKCHSAWHCEHKKYENEWNKNDYKLLSRESMLVRVRKRGRVTAIAGSSNAIQLLNTAEKKIYHDWKREKKKF